MTTVSGNEQLLLAALAIAQAISEGFDPQTPYAAALQDHVKRSTYLSLTANRATARYLLAFTKGYLREVESEIAIREEKANDDVYLDDDMFDD